MCRLSVCMCVAAGEGNGSTKYPVLWTCTVCHSSEIERSEKTAQNR